MTQPTPPSTCDWCRQPDATHTADQHPLPAGHPDYDAFNDAPDSTLMDFVRQAATRPLPDQVDDIDRLRARATRLAAPTTKEPQP